MIKKVALLWIVLLLSALAYFHSLPEEDFRPTVDQMEEDLPPLHLAAAKGDLKLTKKLIDQGTDVNLREPQRQRTPLHCATVYGQKETAKLLVERGADVNARTNLDATPLHDAGAHGRLELARLLIENGAIVDARFTAGHTPLHFAAQGNRVNVLTYLLDQGANIEARTNADETAMSESNETPLHCATDFQCPGTVALLLERGANAEAVNIEGQTPLIIAVSRNNEKIISILLNKNVNMEAKDKLGRTALYIAVNNENESIARLLIGKRANVDSRDDDGWTPLFIAQKKGLKEIAILLEKNGAQHIKNPLEQTAPGKLFKSNHLIDFLWIPAGSFLMGSSEIEAGRSENEGPVHKVNFEKGFWMSKNEVTQTLWYEIMQTNPSAFKRGPNLNIPPDSQWLGKTSLGHNDNSSLINGFDNPVEEVSYDDCQKFISKLNEKEASYKYALPTEAQWEYACRAMSKGPFSFNGEISHSKVVYANRNALLTDLGPNSTDTTACVRSGEPNNWGLYNMHGNVSEWCRDSWHENYTGAPVDGSSWNEERSSAFVIRGGTFNSEGNDCRSTVRTFGLKNYRANDVGLRLVLIYK